MTNSLPDPYVGMPGYKKSWLTLAAYDVDGEERLVLFDRREADPKAKHVHDEPWEVRHMPTNRFKFYRDIEIAKSEAASCAQSSIPEKQWWADGE